MSHIRRQWIVENEWPCSCGTANLGRYTHCQSCGRAKGQEEENRERIDPTQVVTSTAILAQAAEGSHWSCQYCDGKQRRPDGHCQNCGSAQASLQEAKEAPRSGNPSPAGAEPVSAFERSVDILEGRRVPPRLDAPVMPSDQDILDDLHRVGREKLLRQAAAVVLSVLSICGLIAAGVYMFTPHRTMATVTHMQWSHHAEYQERQVFHGEDWGSPPYDVFDTSCRSKYYGEENCHPRKCNAHTETVQGAAYDCRCKTSCTSKKNGFSNCSERCDTCYRKETRTVYETCYDRCPVYRQWCSYSYYKWIGIKQSTAAGEGTQNITWPQLGVDDQSHRHEYSGTHTVQFLSEEGKTHAYHTNEEEYTKFATGQVWNAEYTYAGTFRPITQRK